MLLLLLLAHDIWPTEAAWRLVLDQVVLSSIGQQQRETISPIHRAEPEPYPDANFDPSLALICPLASVLVRSVRSARLVRSLVRPSVVFWPPLSSAPLACFRWGGSEERPSRLPPLPLWPHSFGQPICAAAARTVALLLAARRSPLASARSVRGRPLRRSDARHSSALRNRFPALALSGWLLADPQATDYLPSEGPRPM